MFLVEVIISKNGFYNWEELLLYKIISFDFNKTHQHYKFKYFPELIISPFCKKIVFKYDKYTKFLIEEESMESLIEGYLKYLLTSKIENIFEQSKKSLMVELLKASDKLEYQVLWQSKIRKHFVDIKTINTLSIYNQVKSCEYENYLSFMKKTFKNLEIIKK
jgi:hypothetical protein